MKKIIFKYTKLISFVFLMSAMLVSCKKDKESEGKYSLVYYPSVELEGESIVALKFGETYEEPGFVSLSNGAEIETTVKSDVDDTKTGFYTINYSSTNEDGYSASASRNVIIYDPELENYDYSGSYSRIGQSNVSSNWTKINDYTYQANNPGGVDEVGNPAFNVPFKVYTITPGIIVVPQQQAGQIAPFSMVSVDGDIYIPFNFEAQSGDVAYAWVVLGANFGAALRTFKKL